MELRGIEPLSESLSLQSTTIIVCVLTFPPPGARKRAQGLSSFIGTVSPAKLKESRSPPFMMPVTKGAGSFGPTTA